MRRISIRGVGAAAGMIVLTALLILIAMLAMGDSDMISRIDARMLLGGLVALMSGMLAVVYFSARNRETDSSTRAVGAKAVGIQLLRALLLVIGIIGLILVIGVVFPLGDLLS